MNSFENFLYEQKLVTQIDRVAWHIAETNFPVEKFFIWFEDKGQYLPPDLLEEGVRDFMRGAGKIAGGIAGGLAGGIGGGAVGSAASPWGTAAGGIAGGIYGGKKGVEDGAWAGDKVGAGMEKAGGWIGDKGKQAGGWLKNNVANPVANWWNNAGKTPEDAGDPVKPQRIKSTTGGMFTFGNQKVADIYDGVRNQLLPHAKKYQQVLDALDYVFAKQIAGRQKQGNNPDEGDIIPMKGNAASGTAGVDPNVTKVEHVAWQWQADNKAAKIEAGRQPMVSHTVHNGNLFPESFTHRRTYESFKK